MRPGETFQIEPPERKSSGSGRLLLGIGLGCGIMALLCCGAIGGFFWWAGDFVRQSVSVEPDAVRAATEGIATLDIPERFAPQASFKLDPPFMDEIGTMVIYRNDAAGETLVLGDFRGDPDQRAPSEFFRGIEGGGDSTVGPAGSPFEVKQEDKDPDFEETSRETLERAIRGGTARFEIIQGTNSRTGRERIIVYGTFPGHRGVGVFMMNVDAANSTLEDVKAVIESLE